MKTLHSNGIPADSAVIQIAPGNQLIMTPRETANFSGLDAFVVDSSRLAPKKVSTPVIKTVPYVPENDTISHPDYDVLTGEFIIARDNSITSQLHVNPIAPIAEFSDVQSIVAVDPIEVQSAVANSTLGNSSFDVNDQKQANVFESAEETVADDEVLDTVAVGSDTIAIVPDTVAVDSLNADTVFAESVGSKVFEEKAGKPIVRKTNNFSVNKTAGETDWMLGVIIVAFILFAWTRMIYGKFVGMVTQSAVNFYTARRVYEESNVVRVRVFLLLNMLFYINTGLFVCQCLNFFDISIPNLSGLKMFAIITLVFFAIYTVRTIVLKFLDLIFETSAFGSYNFTIYLYNKVYGLILLPLVAAIPFVPDFVAEKFVWIGILVFVFMYLCTLFRGFRICIKNRVSIFYLFFYLCALEILPLLTIYKCVLKYVL